MNLIVAGIAGSVLAAITAFGGVAAYVGTTTAAPSNQLTQYADR